MGCLYDYYDVKPIKGKDITIGEHFPQVFISKSDEVFCYTGMCLNENPESTKSLFMQPYYLKGIHSTDKLASKEILAFYRIVDGCITLDKYVDDGFYSNRLYKKINCIIKFPCVYGHYEVIANSTEDEELTRKIFGLTYYETTQFLEAYAKTMGTYSEYISRPRLTKNSKNSNYCDLTGVWIPEQFPYVAFQDSGYDFSHVSLYGFYRHIQLLTGYNIDSVFSRALIKQGADETTLNRIFKIDLCDSYYVRILKDTLTNCKF